MGGTLGLTLIHVFGAVPACPGLWADTDVGTQPVLAGASVLTLVPDAVVWIYRTVRAGETWGAEAKVKAGICPWHQLAGGPVGTALGGAGSLPEGAL